MRYTLSLKTYRPSPLFPLGKNFSGVNPAGGQLSFNNFFLERNGKPFFPVSGEFHYSRMDDRRWEDELIKMRMGGVNTVSTYLFWNHIEEEEGVFDFAGRRVRSLTVGLDGSGVGRIWWNEDNSLSQPFYLLMGADVTLSFEHFDLFCTGANLLDREYDTFYFKSVGNSFFQRGKPRRLSAGVRVSF